MITLFNKYLIKRSLYFSLSILFFFGLLDAIFTFIAELENVSDKYNIFNILKYVILSIPHNLIDFLEGACLLGVILALGLSHQEGNLTVLRTAGISPLKIVFTSSIGALILAIPLMVLDEMTFRKIHLNASIDKNVLSEQINTEATDINWIKFGDSYLSFEEIIEEKIFNVRFIKTENNKIIFTAKSDFAEIQQDNIIFSKKTSYKNFINESLKTQSEIFVVPVESKISFSKVSNLGIRDISSYRNLFSQSNLEEDILFKSHLDKVFYKTVFKPISIIALIIYFGSLIFTSLRDSTIGGRIIVAVTGAFIYRLIQDLSLGIFISYNLSVLIGAIIPIALLFILSIISYKKI
tara:strand:- start:176 stop:1228 length:1053 start_codon:yes stop_codon:yes gene_type:complete